MSAAVPDRRSPGRNPSIARGGGLAVLALGLVAGGAAANPVADPAARVAYSLFDPAPDSALRALCTDRPTKSNGPCTVDAGRWQIEADLFDAAVQHTAGARTETYFMADPTVKLGLTNAVDVEFNIAAVESVVTRTPGGVGDSRVTGVGDLYVRTKWTFLGVDGGPVSIALSPYVKLPTARRGVGDGSVEGGLLIPVQFNLPHDWTLGFNGEADVLRNQNNAGVHANYVGAVSLSHPVTKTVTGSVEVWTDIDGDPSGVARQTSVDLALAWTPKGLPNTQFDDGVNVGLNAMTPDAQVYVGVSRRF